MKSCFISAMPVGLAKAICCKECTAHIEERNSNFLKNKKMNATEIHNQKWVFNLALFSQFNIAFEQPEFEASGNAPIDAIDVELSSPTRVRQSYDSGKFYLEMKIMLTLLHC